MFNTQIFEAWGLIGEQRSQTEEQKDDAWVMCSETQKEEKRNGKTCKCDRASPASQA